MLYAGTEIEMDRIADNPPSAIQQSGVAEMDKFADPLPPIQQIGATSGKLENRPRTLPLDNVVNTYLCNVFRMFSALHVHRCISIKAVL